METFSECMIEYKKQMEKGTIIKAYQGLMEYIMELKTELKNRYPEYFVSGSIYYGYMDMTYFSFTPKSIIDKQLKIAIVFIHEKLRFEVWLAGYNRKVQAQYWKLFSESEWNKYSIPHTIKGTDSIVEHILVDKPDFNDLNRITDQIQRGVMGFIKDIDGFLSEH